MIQLLAWNLRTKVRDRQFTARVNLAEGATVFVDVLYLTGPALVENALRSLAVESLHLLKINENSSEAPLVGATTTGALSHNSLGEQRRKVAGENPDNPSTWDRVLWVPSLEGSSGGGGVAVLPYCFFRSRGCAHLQGPKFNDRVVFHHEFDTDWRPSFWHNYYDGDPVA